MELLFVVPPSRHQKDIDWQGLALEVSSIGKKVLVFKIRFLSQYLYFGQLKCTYSIKKVAVYFSLSGIQHFWCVLGTALCMPHRSCGSCVFSALPFARLSCVHPRGLTCDNQVKLFQPMTVCQQVTLFRPYSGWSGSTDVESFDKKIKW